MIVNMARAIRRVPMTGWQPPEPVDPACREYIGREVRDMTIADTILIFIGIISFLISFVINRIVAGMGMEMTLSYIPAWLAGASVVFAVFVGMASGFFPALRAMRLSPLAAIRRG